MSPAPRKTTTRRCTSSDVDILPAERVPPRVSTRTRWIRATICEFYRNSCRKYPWRRRIGVFRTLLTECLLQRTRADAVLQVWPDVMARYGDPNRLAQASVPGLRRLLAPLGFVSRANRLPRLGATIRERHGGRVPRDWAQLVKLPCVGPYVAGATRSFGCGIPEGIVDANVIRFFQRFTGIVVPQGSCRNNVMPGRYWLPTARLLANTSEHKEVNYGLLDFGAQICRPRNPVCEQCPLKIACKFSNETG